MDAGRGRRSRRGNRRDAGRGLPPARAGRMTEAPTREELREHLVRHRIAGDVATPRASNVGNVRKMLDRDPDYWFGVELDRAWTYEDVVAVVAARAGIDPDHTRESGADAVDPDKCINGLDAVAERLAAT